MNSVKLGINPIQPTKILCIGRNYHDHIKELNNPVPDEMVVFNKPPSSIGSQLCSYHGETIHYESEICFLVKNGQYCAVGFGLDLTKRELQSKLKSKGLPWERAKAFDGSAVFSRFLPIEGVDIESLQVELFINCVRVQKGLVTDMIYSPQSILEELRTYTKLEDGDIIMTGTPQGVGEVYQGDAFLGRISCQNNILLEVEWVAQ
ncbi:FAA hydrolase family protein [Vibrio sp. OCN044]|uniref:FAA hydrolase family protein n=1 Tax=Vibrio tetraodonis subsp. pristinus TaxID=2695891 RepID=A0A6L8M2W4_9VIBR|nr:fumarylacetoacetate hydrolase family protein [Vibrio tetraodonis]MYM60139.1 FAA hydrolase family protein [Vibrio tetraodonis subsp. pristinus]